MVTKVIIAVALVLNNDLKLNTEFFEFVQKLSMKKKLSQKM
jgi:hypothetical protein